VRANLLMAGVVLCLVWACGAENLLAVGSSLLQATGRLLGL
jgi:hypothetical protein